MPFNPEDYIAAEGGFDPEAFIAGSDVESRIKELGGIKQPDGTYLVPGEGGTAAFRLDAEGNRLDEAPAIGEESTKEAVLTRTLATAASGAQGFVPQIAGVGEAAAALGQGRDVGEAYRKKRDETKRTIEAAREEAGIGYDILGQIPAALVNPASVAGRVALSGGLGVVNAAAASDVDLTREDADLGKFATDIGTGAAIGTAAAGLGEGVGAAIGKLGGLVKGNAAKAIATQTAKDAALVEKEVASLTGKAGAEIQKGSRLIENLQRGLEGIPDIEGARELAEGVLASNRATLPGQLATIEAAKATAEAARLAAPGKAADMTRDYFAAPLFQTEVLPRLRQTLAPRFGLAAVGLVMGGAADLLTGGDGRSGGFAGAVLGAPGMMQMLRNVAKSPRVQVAIANRLAPMLQNVANSVARVAAPTAALATTALLTEAALGPPNLVAEQLVAQGGLKMALGDNGAMHPDVVAANAPRSELDKAIQQTTGVTLLAGVLEQQHAAVEKGLSRVFAADPKPGKHQPLPEGMAAFGVDTQAMLDRLAENTGNLADVAPGVAAELAATSKRALDYLAKVGAQPAQRGPMAPQWAPSAAERRSIRLAEGVIASPMSVLDAAASGQLVPEQVAALNAVYPMLGRSIADAAISRLEAGAEVPYRARLMLGFLTDTDIDGTFASIGPNQQAIHAQSQKPSNQMPPPSGKPLTLAERTEERNA